MHEDILIWSVCYGAKYARMFRACAESALRLGISARFHAFGTSNPGGPVGFQRLLAPGGAIWAKMAVLEELEGLSANWYLFLDADSIFVRRPADLLAPAAKTGVYVPLEFDLSGEGARFEDWWDVPVADLARLHLWTCNAGLFLLAGHMLRPFFTSWRAALNTCLDRGWQVTEEVPLSMAAHAYACRSGVWAHPDYWVSDWAGRWCGRVPGPEPWEAEEYMTGVRRIVNPAIIHAMRSKAALESLGRWYSLAPALNPQPSTLHPPQ